MQTLIQVYCKGEIDSLRLKIYNDKENLKDFYLKPKIYRKQGRSKGWSTLTSNEANGTLNMKWDSTIKLLSTIIKNRGEGKPDNIAGLFISYLMREHNKIIKNIHIIPIG
jgi:hypothetical protein